MIENVVPIPTALERLALRAAQAMADYRAGVNEENHGRTKTIHAVLAYGRALQEGREDRDNNIAFANWVSANQLDVGKPWDQRAERHAAMHLARVVGNVPDNAFEGCTNTRPVDIMKWYRKKEGTYTPRPRKQKPGDTPKADLAYEAILAAEARGETIPPKRDFAAEIGVSHATVEKALDRRRQEKARPPELPLDLDHLSEKSKLTLAKAIEIEKKRLAKAFYAQVQAEVRRIIDTADDHVRARLKEVEAQVDGMRRMLQTKGVFTRLEFKQLLMCVHPDNKLSASDDVRNRIFDILRRAEARLVKE